MGDEPNSKKRKNKSKYLGMKKTKSHSPGSLAANQNGFVITCNFNEKKALSEAYNILNAVTQQRDEPVTSGDVDDDLKQELEELKSERPFKQVKTECKNVIFVKINRPDYDPIDIMNRIFSTIETSEDQPTINCRFICKMLPIMKTTDASKTNILNCLTSILKEDKVDKATFKIEITNRINSKIVRNEIIPEMAAIVNQIKPEWTVDLNDPKKVIYLDVMHMVAGLSILGDYVHRNRYSLHTFCNRFADEEIESKNDNKNEVKEQLNKGESNDKIVDDVKTEDVKMDDVKTEDVKMDDVKAEDVKVDEHSQKTEEVVEN